MSFGNTEYIERIETENRRLKAINKELLKILKAVMEEPVPTVRLDGRVYMAQINLGLYEEIKRAITKAEGKEDEVESDNNTASREMTLKNWVKRLPENHRAHKEYIELLEALKKAKELLSHYQPVGWKTYRLMETLIAKAEAEDEG